MISSRTSKHNKARHSFRLLMGVLAGSLAGVGRLAAVGSPAPHSELISEEQWQQLNLEGIRTVREFLGVVWVGGDGGLAAFENGRWRQWGVAEGLPVRRVAALDMDLSTRDLWIGTLGGGLVRYSAGRFDVFNQFNSGLAGNLVFSVAVVRDRVYASTNGGVCEFEPSLQSWDLLVPRRANEAQQVATNLWTEGGRLFADMWPDGVFRWDFSARTWVSGGKSQTAELLPSDRTPHTINSARPTKRQPTIAILGPGTRRMVLPDGRETPRDLARQGQPDIAAVQLAVRTSSETGTNPDVVLWQPAPGYAGYGWGLLEDDLVGFAENSELVGLVAHLNERQLYTAASVSFMEIPAVNVATEPLNIGSRASQRRWIFSCRKDQPQRHRALLEFVRQSQRDHWVIVECDATGETALRTAWTRSFASRMGVKNVEYISVTESSQGSARRLIDSKESTAVFLWGDSTQARRLMQTVTDHGQNLLFAGGSELAIAEIRDLAEKSGWTMVVLDPIQPSSLCAPELSTVRETMPTPRASSEKPDELACRTFDGADHLLSAIRSGPPGRNGLASTLLHMEQDDLGESHYEARHGKTAVRLSVLQGGQWRSEEFTAPPITADSDP